MGDYPCVMLPPEESRKPKVEMVIQRCIPQLDAKVEWTSIRYDIVEEWNSRYNVNSKCVRTVFEASLIDDFEARQCQLVSPMPACRSSKHREYTQRLAQREGEVVTGDMLAEELNNCEVYALSDNRGGVGLYAWLKPETFELLKRPAHQDWFEQWVSRLRISSKSKRGLNSISSRPSSNLNRSSERRASDSDQEESIVADYLREQSTPSTAVPLAMPSTTPQSANQLGIHTHVLLEQPANSKSAPPLARSTGSMLWWPRVSEQSVKHGHLGEDDMPAEAPPASTTAGMSLLQRGAEHRAVNGRTGDSDVLLDQFLTPTEPGVLAPAKTDLKAAGGLRGPLPKDEDDEDCSYGEV